ARIKRHKRVRKQIMGTPEKPRLSVFKSNRHIYAQIINDLSGVTLVAASTLDKELKGKVSQGGDTEAAKSVGALIAQRALKKKISEVVFDRGGFLYHGRVKVLAEATREAGLKF
ncbi:MAG: 50S ribosomal protein L18, partial [Candidatus Subteraquimicrobiales bacterium]|nr:50S ribosomal protein L18 [Candidatus Subteraquimicrobiales bacterium]